MLKLSKEEFESAKSNKINNGESVKQLRAYIFKTFEEIIKQFVGSTIIIIYQGEVSFNYSYNQYNIIDTQEKYIFNDINSNDLDYIIEKWKIVDILINFDEIEKEFRLILMNGDEILISIIDWIKCI